MQTLAGQSSSQAEERRRKPWGTGSSRPRSSQQRRAIIDVLHQGQTPKLGAFNNQRGCEVMECRRGRVGVGAVIFRVKMKLRGSDF